VAARLNATFTAGAEEHEYRRGREAGLTWAAEYATSDELSGLIENLRRGREASLGCDDPHWRGFFDGVQEVNDVAGPAAPEDADVEDRYERGREDGLAWASEFATAGELRDLVNLSERADGPHWRGFVDGAEEVLDAAGPLLDGPIPHDYRHFLKWLLEFAP
jgi:hypothetical protein